MPQWRVAFRATVQTDLAAAYAQQGEVEQACSALAQALSVTVAERARHNIHRAVGIRQRWPVGWADLPAVKQLDEQLHSLN